MALTKEQRNDAFVDKVLFRVRTAGNHPRDWPVIGASKNCPALDKTALKWLRSR